VAVLGVGKKDRHHHGEIDKRLEGLAHGGKLAAKVLDSYRSIAVAK
jgi:hypothetical protein